MLLEIVQYGNPVLKEKCRPVEHLDASLKDLANNMLETMYAAEGVGLAAPQVNVPVQLVVIDIPAEEESVTWLKVDGEDKQLSDIMPLKFINPVLEPYGPMHPCHEGCLSVLKIRASVVRPDFVRATLTLLDGKRIDGFPDRDWTVCLEKAPASGQITLEMPRHGAGPASILHPEV